MSVIDILQWAAILCLGVMCFGLTRQLGHFLQPHVEQVLSMGPDVGQELSEQLLTGDERLAFDALRSDATTDVGAIVVLNEQCSGCLGLVDSLERDGFEQLGPLAVVAKEASPAFVERLRMTFPLVVVDAESARTAAAGIVANPALLIVDSDYKVVHREFGGNITSSLGRWSLVRQDLEGAGEIAPLSIHHHAGSQLAHEEGIA